MLTRKHDISTMRGDAWLTFKAGWIHPWARWSNVCACGCGVVVCLGWGLSVCPCAREVFARRLFLQSVLVSSTGCSGCAGME